MNGMRLVEHSAVGSEPTQRGATGVFFGVAGSPLLRISEPTGSADFLS